MPSRPATLPPQDNATTALYRAALGPVGASYYLKVFARFDETGLPGPSWNTMAACFTLGWLVYRRLWGAAFAYAVLLSSVAAALWFEVGPWMAWPAEGRWAAAVALVVLCCVLPGCYANVLLHGELRRRMTEAVREAATVQQARQWLAAQASGPGLLGLLVFLYLVLGSGAAGWWWQHTRTRALPPASSGVEQPAPPPSQSVPPPLPAPVSAVSLPAQPAASTPTPVAEQAPAPAPEQTPVDSIRPRLHGYGVAVGLFAEPANARRAESRLREAGLPVVIDPVESARGPLTRVRVGPLPDRAAADAAARQIRALGLEALVYGP